MIFEFSPYLKENTVTITNMNLLTLFKEIVPVYTDSRTESKNTNCRVTELWVLKHGVPTVTTLDLKGLMELEGSLQLVTVFTRLSNWTLS
jgi:hypothetical protein